MPSNLKQFEDRKLKELTCRAWGNERCPLALRERLEKFRTEPVELVNPRVLRIAIFSGIAAAVLVMVGIVQWGSVGGNSPIGPVSPVATGPLASGPLAAGLVDTHLHCCHAEDHHGVPSDDFATIAKAVHSRISDPAVAGSPGQPWVFKGAAFCPVNGEVTGHLVFWNGSQRISLFAMSHKNVSVSDGWKGETQDDKLAIAGFAKSGAVLFIVGSDDSGAFPVSRLQGIRDSLMQSGVIAAISYTDLPAIAMLVK